MIASVSHSLRASTTNKFVYRWLQGLIVRSTNSFESLRARTAKGQLRPRFPRGNFQEIAAEDITDGNFDLKGASVSGDWRISAALPANRINKSLVKRVFQPAATCFNSVCLVSGQANQKITSFFWLFLTTALSALIWPLILTCRGMIFPISESDANGTGLLWRDHFSGCTGLLSDGIFSVSELNSWKLKTCRKLWEKKLKAGARESCASADNRGNAHREAFYWRQH